MPLKGVIYDLDGTLVDSRDDLADSVNAMLARLSLPEREPQVIHGFIGEGAERLIRRSLGPRHEARYAEAAPIWREEYGKRLLAKTRLYGGVDALLRVPPEARGVLTNKPGGFAREILRGLGIESAFQAVVGVDEASRRRRERRSEAVPETVRVVIGKQEMELKVVEGTEGEKGIEISDLRTKTGLVTLDPAFMNTASTESAVTFLDGEKGILRYRGIPIEELGERSTFTETAYRLIYGHLPSREELSRWEHLLTRHSMIHED